MYQSTPKQTCYMFVLLVYPSLKFHSTSLYNQPFWVAGHFETSALNDPQMIQVPYICFTRVYDLERYKVKVLHKFKLINFKNPYFLCTTTGDI